MAARHGLGPPSRGDALGAPPRTASPLDAIRKACTELSAFLEIEAPGGGHAPAALRAGHAERFAADQRDRERHQLASLVMRGGDGKPSTVTATTRAAVFNGVRTALRGAMDSGEAERLGLRREFITAIPAAGGTPRRARRPFPDEVSRALADEASLARLAADHDPDDQGMRDIWETIVCTGRRVNEVLRLRLDCIGRCGGLPLLWHDQTKVGNLDAAIRIPERIYQVLGERQAKTADRFTARHGRRPADAERAVLALFPSPAAISTAPAHWTTRGSANGSGAGSTDSSSAATSPTRPGTPWPRTCKGAELHRMQHSAPGVRTV